jgi:hypothetical protein
MAVLLFSGETSLEALKDSEQVILEAKNLGLKGCQLRPEMAALSDLTSGTRPSKRTRK